MPVTCAEQAISDPSRLAGELLRWYAREHRRLPWRAAPGRLPDPYAVLVSEAMLQQTRVETVIPFYQRFIEELPTLEDLAAAGEQKVLRLWQGLGYYRRARHLHQAAQHIVTRFGGRVPDTPEELKKLPGVGPYTAGAIASLAFDRPEPVLDGNVARVLARLLAVDEPVDDTAVKNRLATEARKLVEAGRGLPIDHQRNRKGAPRRFTAGDLNQALMELGARICVAGSPACLLCPVAAHCRAQQRGEAERYPITGAKTAQKRVTHRLLAIRKGERWLFEQRGSDGLWAGMWQLPTWEGRPEDEPAEAQGASGNGAAAVSARGLRQRARQRFGLELGRLTRRGSFEHQTTHRRIRFAVWTAEVQGGRLRPRSGVWRRLDRLDDLPLSNPQRRAVQMLNG